MFHKSLLKKVLYCYEQKETMIVAVRIIRLNLARDNYRTDRAIMSVTAS